MIKISINDKIYPEALRIIPNSPSILYLEGNINLLNSKSIAIIGARNCSENGKEIASKFSTELSSSGITIVSGLAKGIDTIAHYSSYLRDGKTIAVLAGGFNNIFPKENVKLYQKILENDGLIISEYPPDVEAVSKNFLQRNRIISGISLGVLIIEALSRSGTSYTAKLAKAQNKVVFAIPHEIWDPRGVGTNRLLKNGAKIVTNTSDILRELHLNRYHNNYLNLKKQGLFDKPFKTFENPIQSKIFEFINYSPTSVNELAKKTGYSINDVLSNLFILEVDGNIKKVQGGYICT